jgi:parallel beta-helix repeat protein
MKGILVFSLALGLVCLVGSTAFGAIIHVPGDHQTIQDAIDAASDGDTVLVDDGTYIENIDFMGKAIAVKSVNGAASTIIDGNASGSVVMFVSGEGTDSVLEGFTITKGTGSGITCRGSSPTITDCTISGNTADKGGGIYTGQSSPTISDCTIKGNSADEGGGILCIWDSSPMIENCTISENSAPQGGGISCNGSSPTITNCNIKGNECGGILCIWDSSPTIEHCTIKGNECGGIGCNGSSPTISNCTIKGNTADAGGGIGCWDSSPTISNSTITGNTAIDRHGGGILCLGESSPTIEHCTISYNTATGGGGGISAFDSSPTITDCTIKGNTAGSAGGISAWESSSMVTNCIISGNTAKGSPSNGGGIGFGLYSSLTLTNCIISGNTAKGSPSNGGGIGFGLYSSLTLTNCIISGNTAKGAYSNGGGITCYESSLTLTNCTISGNTANGTQSIGGGINCSESSPTITNCTITGNTEEYKAEINEMSCAIFNNDGNGVFTYNNIFNHAVTYELNNGNPAGSADLNAENNWWGTATESEIQDKIYDWFDDNSRGLVDYSPFLSSPDTTAPISPPSNLRVTQADMGGITLQWDANPEGDSAGYRVYWETDDYEHVVDAGTKTLYTIPAADLPPYIAVTAYDNDYADANDDPDTIVNENQTNGNESWYAGGNLPPTTTTPDSPSPGLTTTSVDAGDLVGAKMIFDSNEPVRPIFGFMGEIPDLNVSGVDAAGVPVNLQPPTVFNSPVTLFIPCPGRADVSNLAIYFYNGTSWVLACDASGTVQPGGEGWLVPGSRVNHNNGSPSTIEIQVYHFTGVQAGSPSGSGGSGTAGGGGGCFIDTAGE